MKIRFEENKMSQKTTPCGHSPSKLSDQAREVMEYLGIISTVNPVIPIKTDDHLIMVKN